MNFHIITPFPEICQTYTDAGVLGRAQKTDKGKGAKVRGKKITVTYYDPRDFTKNKHKKIDDRPFGGGPGMVLTAEPILRAWDKAVGRKRDQKKVKTFIMSPRGKTFDAFEAQKLARSYEHIVLISGRYEGIDSRVKKALKAEEISIGEYVLTGGELPALVILDAVARHVPGVLGENESLEEKRLTSGEMYTRPESFQYKKKTFGVPKVLLSGNHKQIEEWHGK